MPLEYLKQIQEAEAEADRIRRGGVSEAKSVIKSAKDEAAGLVEKAEAEADVSYKETVAHANSDALSDYNRTIRQVEWECNMLFADADRNFDAAVSLIVRKVVDS